MATSRAEALLRDPARGQRVTFLELFFDLVFVFALFQLTDRLLTDVTSQRQIVVTEAGQTLLLLLALMMVWFATTWTTDLYDPQRPKIQLVVAATMFGALVMAVALPEAFGPRGLEFAGAYVAIHIFRGLVLVPALRGHEAQRRAASVLVWFVVSAVPWIAGATFPESPARGGLWALAIAIEYTGALLLFPAPWLPRPTTARWPVMAEHLAERYWQFITIALGELILVIGLAQSAHYPPGGATVAAFVVSFAITALLWRIYIYRAGALLPTAIAAAPTPARLVRRAFVAHVIMVAGIVVAAVGYDVFIGHPLGHTDPAWIGLIIGGPILFLAGRMIFGYAIFARLSRARLVGILVLAGTSPVMILLPPLAVAVTAALVLAGLVTFDAVSGRRSPPASPSPPG